MKREFLDRDLRCKKCGYTWLRRVNIPKRCPKCTNPSWEDDAKRKIKQDHERTTNNKKEVKKIKFD